MAKTNQVAKIEAESESEATTPREVRPIKPTSLTWQYDGQIWREGLVRLPEEIILQDLQDSPELWRSVQSNPQTALRKYDRLLIVSWDESWLLKDVLVVEADHQRAVLSIKSGDMVRMPAKNAEWEDSLHRIRWETSGFAIFRRSDDVVMLPQRFASIEAAKSAMYAAFYTKPQGQRVA